MCFRVEKRPHTCGVCGPKIVGKNLETTSRRCANAIVRLSQIFTFLSCLQGCKPVPFDACLSRCAAAAIRAPCPCCCCCCCVCVCVCGGDGWAAVHVPCREKRTPMHGSMVHACTKPARLHPNKNRIKAWVQDETMAACDVCGRRHAPIHTSQAVATGSIEIDDGCAGDPVWLWLWPCVH
jgi:hypothetical protein